MISPKAHIVIGAGYGDEGKGLITDGLVARTLASGQSVRVVRFNGGAQAGHTVQTPQGQRHVFHHFGAGALAGASTHLGQRFVIQPMLFGSERETLLGLNANTQVSIDPRAMLTLPCDVMINQAIEHARGQSRHGSCGVGFGEAVHRNETGQPQHRLALMDLSLLGITGLRTRWDAIWNTYVPARLAALSLPTDALSDWQHASGDAGFARFVQDCEYLLEHVVLALPCELEEDVFVLEGAQGLALDEDIGAFPYVTRSKTGLPWALEFLNQIPGPKIESTVWYLTRAYATRHGAGPFEHQSAWMPPNFEDQTNQPNAYQGTLRVAPLDVEALEARIQSDLRRAAPLLGRVKLSLGVSVSCLDQMGDLVPLSDGRTRNSDGFAHWLSLRLGMAHTVQSWGPSRASLTFT